MLSEINCPECLSRLKRFQEIKMALDSITHWYCSSCDGKDVEQRINDLREGDAD